MHHVTWCHVGTASRDVPILLADMKAPSTSQAKKTETGAVRTTASQIMGNTRSSAELHVALLVIPSNRYAGVLVTLTSGLLRAKNLTSKRQESSNCSSHLQTRSRCMYISSLGRMSMPTTTVLHLTFSWLQQSESTSLSSVILC